MILLAVTASLAAAILGRPGLAFLGASVLLMVVIDALAASWAHLDIDFEVDREQVTEAETFTVTTTSRGSGRRKQVKLDIDPTFRIHEGSNVWDLEPGTRSMSLRIEATARGPRSIGPVTIRSWSPFRLWVQNEQSGQAKGIQVRPRMEPVDEVGWASRVLKPMAGRFSVNRPGQGFDFFNLRGYESSDTIRDINWKATARTDDLIVNQRLRESQTEAVILLDHRVQAGAGFVGRTPLDRSCRVAMGLLQELDGNRDIVHFCLYGPSAVPLRPGRDRLLHAASETLAALRAEGATPLDDAWGRIQHSMRSHGPVFVLSSLEGDPSCIKTIANIVARGHPVTVISPCPTGPTWNSPEARQRRTAREDTIRRIQGLGAVLVDWSEDELLRAQAPLVGRGATT